MTKILNINATKSVGKNASLELEKEDLISSVNTILSFTPILQLFHGYPEPELSNTTYLQTGFTVLIPLMILAFQLICVFS